MEPTKSVKWISVKDKLPKRMTNVIVYCKAIEHYKGLPVGSLSEYDEWENIDGLGIRVTHWMPFPNPPKN